MKTLKLNWFNLLVIFSLVLGLIGCSSSSDSDDSSQSTINLNSFVPVSSVTIDESGGIISGDGLYLALPKATLSSSTDINLSSSTQLIDELQIGNTYSIKGLPSTLNQPLSISLQIPDGVDLAEGSYIVLRELFEDGSLSRAIHWESTVNENNITAILPATTTAIVNKVIKKNSTIDAIKDNLVNFIISIEYGYKEINKGHFKILYPGDSRYFDIKQEDVQDIINALENYYSLLEAYGFSWKKRTVTPIVATFRQYSSDEYYGEMNPLTSWGSNAYEIFLNYHYIIGDNKDLDALKMAAGHELFHIVQSLYDPNELANPEDWFWVNEATAVWFEYQINKQVDYISDTLKQDIGSAGPDYTFLFNHALEYKYDTEQTGEIEAHGYGASSFMSYITDMIGIDLVSDIYNNRLLGFDTIPSINKALQNNGTNISTIWKEFCEVYVEGSYLGTGTMDRYMILNILSQYKKKYTFDSKDDLGESFVWESASDLSARMYKIDVKYSNESWKGLSFSLLDESNTANAIVYKYDKNIESIVKLGEIQTNSKEFLITDIETLANNNTTLLVIISNSNYTGTFSNTQNITLDVAIKKTLNVESTTPSDKTTNISTSATISATFNNEINTTTLTSNSFSISGVNGLLSLGSDKKTVTFTPSSNLNYGKTYTATIYTTLSDTNGFMLDEPYSWSFTTEKEEDSSTNTTDGVLIDNEQGYIWQDNIIPKLMNWKDATAYCQNLTLAGYDDWELPRANDLAVADMFSSVIKFQNSIDGGYWALETDRMYAPTSAYVVFSMTNYGLQKIDNNFYVRCVKDDPNW